MKAYLFFSFFLVILFFGCKKENKCIEGNCINGVGIYQFASGGIDSGQFVDGWLNGAGKRVYGEAGGGRFSGDMYVGEFKDGKQDGFGTYYF